MKRTLFIFIALYNILFLLPFGGGSVAVAQVVATIDSVQMMIGEQTGLHVAATVKPNQKVVFQQWKPQQVLVPGIEVVEAPKVDTVDASDGFVTITQHLTITAWEDSVFYIPQMKVKIDGKVLESKSLALKVLTVEVDTLHPNQYFGPRDVQDNPFLWEEWSALLWFTLLAIILYALAWVAYVRLKSNKPITLKVRFRKIIPPHQKALSEIESLKSDQQNMSHADAFGPEQTDNYLQQKQYYTKLTDALRTYLEERFGFNAMEMTSYEIISRLKQEKDAEKLQELTQLFETADLVKFAKFTVGVNENDRNLVSAIDFINQTKQENMPTEERIEPTVTEQQRQTMRVRLSLKWAIVILTIAIAAIIAYIAWQLYDLRG